MYIEYNIHGVLPTRFTFLLFDTDLGLPDTQIQCKRTHYIRSIMKIQITHFPTGTFGSGFSLQFHSLYNFLLFVVLIAIMYIPYKKHSSVSNPAVRRKSIVTFFSNLFPEYGFFTVAGQPGPGSQDKVCF